MTNSVFSDYEIDRCSVKFDGDVNFIEMNCIGSMEESLNTKIVSKNCRGKLAKQTVKGAGDGTLTISAHIPWAVFKKAFGMVSDSVVGGVMAYGESSRHKCFSLVCHVVDEDGAEKLRAYPKCIITNGLARKTENGAEEVAESEIEVTVMPDVSGFCVYETIVGSDGDGADSSIINSWMTNFSSDLVKKSSSQVSITLNLTGCFSTNLISSINSGDSFVTNFIPNDGFVLPDSVTVTKGGSSASAGSDYIFDSLSGLFAFPSVSSNLVVTVSCDDVD